MSDMKDAYGATINATISSTVTPSVNCGGCAGVIVHILTTSSLQFQADISVDGTNWATQRVINYKTGAETAAGSNITPSANDVYYIPVGGAEKCRIRRDTAGSGTLSMRPAFATEALMDQSVSVSGAVDTELAAAAAASDTFANPTTAPVLGMTHFWDGSQWVRAKMGSQLSASSLSIAFPSNQSANVQSAVAHDAADSGNPLKIGGKARTTNPSKVADADRVDGSFDAQGKQIVRPFGPRELQVRQTTTIAASTSETTILTAGAAGVFHDITLLTIANTSATAARVDIRDATAGSVIASLYIPAGDTRGFALSDPMAQTTAANNWTAQSSASITDLRIFVIANKVL